jgi:hypothetical protein
MRNLILYSDSCYGTNKNFTAIAVFSYFVQSGHFDSVEQKFLVSGDTFIPCDRDFGIIEKRKLQYLFLPDEWADVIQRSQNLRVYRTKQTDFLDFTVFLERHQKRSVTENGEKVDFQNAKILHIHKDAPITFFIKWSYKDNELFKSVNLNKVKKGRLSCFAKEGLSLMGVQPQQKYSAQRAIKSTKYRDLQSILPFIPPTYHHFYQNIPLGDTNSFSEVQDNILDYNDC